MSIVTMILGESGTGKSASMRNLIPADTLLIQAVPKPLPFRAAGWGPLTKETPNGNVFVSDQADRICAILRKTTRSVIVIDDFQYVLSNEFMRRVTDKEVGNAAFAKYNEIARSAWDILTCAAALPEHKRVYLLSHTTTDEFGNTKIKTIGKLLDEKIVLEGMVSIVLRTKVANGEYVFSTKNSGSDTVKAPMQMFENATVENDLKAVDAAITDYYYQPAQVA